MTTHDRRKQAEEKAKQTADKLFREKSAELKKILEQETTVGSPDNLVKPDPDADAEDAAK